MFRFLTIVAAVVATTTVSAAETRQVEAAATLVSAASPAQLMLKRNGAGFVLADGARVQLRLALRARLSDSESNVRIVASEVSLKDGGKSGEAAALESHSLSATGDLTGDYDFAFAVDAQGVLAQNAAAACSAAINTGTSEGSERTAHLTATAVWRLTAGRFNFPWTQYDRVSVDEDVRANPDFYGERETLVRDVAVLVTLTCRDDAAAKVVQKAGPEPVKTSTAKVSPALHAERAKPETAMPESTATVPASLARGDTTEAIPQPQKPQCSGGMIRETSLEAGGYICLCPGNTQRVSTGANAFSCQKIARR